MGPTVCRHDWTFQVDTCASALSFLTLPTCPGMVTQVAIQCAPRPASVQSVFLACPSFEAVVEVRPPHAWGGEGSRPHTL